MCNFPARLRQNGRGIDPVFDGDERMYYRTTRQFVVSDKFIATAFRFPDFSVNRAKYSEPLDALLEARQGEDCVIAFAIEDIPEPFRIDGSVCDYRPIHLPYTYNYSHSEVQAWKNGAFDRERDRIPKLAKSHFRRKIHQKLLLMEPGGEFVPVVSVVAP